MPKAAILKGRILGRCSANRRDKNARIQCKRDRQCFFIDRHDEIVEYSVGWELQKALVEKRIQAVEDGQRISDTLVMLQHSPVYTLGTGSTIENVLFDIENPPHPVFRTERGGEVTYHGPGQLVLYPILDLRHNHTMDLHWYLRNLEETVIMTLGRFNIKGERINGLTGVWVEGKKVAAIGIRVRRWITYHGVAINVDNDLAPFDEIIPCGIQDRPVTSMKELSRAFPLEELPQDEIPLVSLSSHKDNLLGRVRDELLSSFSEVFDVDVSTDYPLI